MGIFNNSKNLCYTNDLICKSETDEWVEFEGLATAEKYDLADEIIESGGIDTSIVKAGKAYVNDNHGRSYKDNKDFARCGVLDSAKVTKEGLIVKGRIFKNHPGGLTYINEMKAKPGMVQLSFEGYSVSRDPFEKNRIKKAIMTGVALTRSPVLTDTYVKLLKSLVEEDEITKAMKDKQFMPNLLEEINKALETGGAQYAKTTPNNFTDGTVFMKESIDKEDEEEKKKKGEIKMTEVNKLSKSEQEIVEALEKSEKEQVKANSNDMLAEVLKSLQTTMVNMNTKIDNLEKSKEVVKKEEPQDEILKSMNDLQKMVLEQKQRNDELQKSLTMYANRPAGTRQSVSNLQMINKSNEDMKAAVNRLNLKNYFDVMKKVDLINKSRPDLLNADDVINYNVSKRLTDKIIKAIENFDK